MDAFYFSVTTVTTVGLGDLAPVTTIGKLFTDLRADPALLPVWINAYQFRGETYRFLVNGQTGEVIGIAPISYVKVFLVALAIVAVALLILALVTARSG